MLLSSSGSGDGNSHNLAIMMESNVLRLIRRYDPVGPRTTGIRNRCSLEEARDAWHNNASKSLSSLPSNASSSSCSYLPLRTINSSREDNGPVKQPSTPRLQRQQAIHEPEPSLSSSPNISNSIRPILKYTPPTSRAELNIPHRKTEPLTINIEPQVPPPPPPVTTNENTNTYQPLITTGTKRVCAAISKSEWDLRLQNDLSSPTVPPLPSPPTLPAQPSSPQTTIGQQQEKVSYRPLFGRSKSSMGINNNNSEHDNDIDDFDENSAPITAGSGVNKLKQIFITKSAVDLTNSPIIKQRRIDSTETNLNRNLNINGTNINRPDVLSSTFALIQKVPNSNSIESQVSSIPNSNLTKPTTIIQEAVPTHSPSFKRPILRSQKTFDRYVEIIFLIDKYNNENKKTTTNMYILLVIRSSTMMTLFYKNK
jgi:hypothetical protein